VVVLELTRENGVFTTGRRKTSTLIQTGAARKYLGMNLTIRQLLLGIEQAITKEQIRGQGSNLLLIFDLIDQQQIPPTVLTYISKCE
jgi:hypothetical protein